MAATSFELVVQLDARFSEPPALPLGATSAPTRAAEPYCILRQHGGKLVLHHWKRDGAQEWFRQSL